MLCDKCKKNEATVHIKEFHNNKCTDLHLCQECASQHGPSDLLSGLGFNLADVLMNVDKIKKKPTFSPKTPQNGVENAPSKSILFREMT